MSDTFKRRFESSSGSFARTERENSVTQPNKRRSDGVNMTGRMNEKVKRWNFILAQIRGTGQEVFESLRHH